MATKQANRITEANGDTPTPTVAELKAANAARASEEINAILQKYDCALFPRLLITNQGQQFEVQIVSK